MHCGYTSENIKGYNIVEQLASYIKMNYGKGGRKRSFAHRQLRLIFCTSGLLLRLQQLISMG